MNEIVVDPLGNGLIKLGLGQMASNIANANASLYPEKLVSVAANMPTHPPPAFLKKASAKHVP